MPRRSWQLVCGAAMALLFAALLMLWSQSDGTVEFGTSAHAAAHGESAGTSTEPVDRPAADRARAELVGLQQGSNATVTPSGTMVRVVAKATGQPLLDAEVWCDDPEFDPHTLSRSDSRRL